MDQATREFKIRLIVSILRLPGRLAWRGCEALPRRMLPPHISARDGWLIDCWLELSCEAPSPREARHFCSAFIPSSPQHGTQHLMHGCPKGSGGGGARSAGAGGCAGGLTASVAAGSGGFCDRARMRAARPRWRAWMRCAAACRSASGDSVHQGGIGVAEDAWAAAKARLGGTCRQGARGEK